MCSAINKITLTDTKGLSDLQTAELLKTLLDLAQQNRGDETIYMLAQHVQEFLHANNKPPAGSLYDEMLHERRVRRSVEAAVQLQREQQPHLLPQQQQFTVEQQTIRDQVMQRKEMYHSEPRRRDLRRSISEASPTHPHHPHHRSNSASDNSENSGGDGPLVMAPGAGGHYRSPLIYPNCCSDHRCSEVLYLVNVARRIQKGCCLGE